MKTTISKADISKKQPDSGSYSVALVLDAGTIDLNNSDIKQLYFIEDIFSFSITGKIQFIDRFGLLEYGPITGNEVIKILYGDKEDIIEKEFLIYKISNISQMGSANPTDRVILEMYFVDYYFLPFNKKEYSFSWKDTKISDIVKDISKNMLGFDDFEEFEETKEILPYFYMPYWTPQQSINWLISRSSGINSGVAGYLFYNNTKKGGERDGVSSHNFITLDKLLSNTKILKLNPQTDDGLYIFEGINIFEYNKIINFTINSVDGSSMKGIMGGRKYGFDPDTKSIIDRSYTYTSSLLKTTILGSKSLFRDISNAEASHTLTGETNPDIIDNIGFNNWTKRYNCQQMLSILLKGHENRYAGAMIEIVWPSVNRQALVNKGFEGAYLIKSITHFFSPNPPHYLQKMVLIKNGYTDSDNRFLVNATKTNTLAITTEKNILRGS